MSDASVAGLVCMVETSTDRLIRQLRALLRQIYYQASANEKAA